MIQFQVGQQVLVDGKQLGTVKTVQYRKEADGLASGKDRCKVLLGTSTSQHELWIPHNRLSAVTVKAMEQKAEEKEAKLEEVNQTPRDETAWVEKPVIAENASNIVKGVNTGSSHAQMEEIKPEDFQG